MGGMGGRCDPVRSLSRSARIQDHGYFAGDSQAGEGTNFPPKLTKNILQHGPRFATHYSDVLDCGFPYREAMSPESKMAAITRGHLERNRTPFLHTSMFVPDNHVRQSFRRSVCKLNGFVRSVPASVARIVTSGAALTVIAMSARTAMDYCLMWTICPFS